MNNKTSSVTGSSNASSKVEIIKLILDGIIDAIKAGGAMGAPGGILYAALMSQGCTLNQFHSLMAILINGGRVELRGQCYFLKGGAI